MKKDTLFAVQSKLRLWLATAWFLFVTSMVVWWWLYGLAQIGHPPSIDPEVRYRMLFGEGVVFLAAIVGGGIAFLYLLYKDFDRHLQLRNFFSIFTHDIKTSIARLRLQADLLREEEDREQLSAAGKKTLNRLVNDINRLDLQLENALFISRNPKDILVTEKFLLAQVIERVRPEFPELEIRIDRGALIFADHRAFTSCIRNLIQNSVLHGGATAVAVAVTKMENQRLQISIEDNGKGFTGDFERLGQAIRPMNDTGGNGIGLYLTRSIMEKMKGQISFGQGKSGFKTTIQIPGEAL